jgi:hypothetical protein
MSAPERIWLDWPGANKGDVVYDEPPERDTQPGQTEYVRADLVDILRADRDSAARMWQASKQEREAAVDRAREASQYLAIETQHAAQAEARAEAAEARIAELTAALDALDAIAKMATPFANATVRRMADAARAALAGKDKT